MDKKEFDQVVESPVTPSTEPSTEPTATPSRYGIYPTFVDILAIFAIFILSGIVAAFIGQGVATNWEFTPLTPLENAQCMLITTLITFSLMILFLTILRKSRNAARPKLRLGIKGFNPTLVLLGFVMIVATSIIIEPLLTLLPAPPSLEGRGWQLLVAVVVCAPILEEIVCRGMIFESMRSKWGLVAAWIGSSVIFAIMHGQPTLMVNAFFMGLILCFFAVYSGTLWTSIALHAMNNALAYILFLLGWGSDAYLSDLITNKTIYAVVYILAAVVLVVTIPLCIRQIKRSAALKKGEQQTDATIK